MSRRSCIFPSTTTVVVWGVVALFAATAIHAILVTDAHAAVMSKKDARCRTKVTRSLTQLASKHMKTRGVCAEQQAVGTLTPSVNCMGEPTKLGGPGTGAPNIDKRLNHVADKAASLGFRIGTRCSTDTRSPASLDLDTLCPNPQDAADDWRKMMECGYDLVREAGDRLQSVIYRQNDSPMGSFEVTCRTVLGDRLTSALRGRMRQRGACFDRRETNLNCMATSAWPGKTLPTGFKPADRELPAQMMALRDATNTSCSFTLAAADFTDDPRIDDPTIGAVNGGEFTTEDLFHELADVFIVESTRVVAAMFPGFSYCGDGIVDVSLAEECDDGIDNLVSCDGCDRDCTLSAACNNGAACGTETCDDGNTALGDGCDAACALESCGDGIVQPGLGETCDDGNEIDCDGCDSNCTPSDLCNNGVACASTGEQCDLGTGVCIRGFDHFEACVSDTECRGSCESGPEAGRVCMSNADCGENDEHNCQVSLGCGGFCIGGANNNDRCLTDEDCPGTCRAIMGTGLPCTVDSDCFLGLNCNRSGACVLPAFNDPCSEDGDCGLGGECVPSSGCKSGNSDTRPDVCRNDCQFPICGDAVTDGDTNTNGFGQEECDDGNFADDDGCDSNCTITACGNGILTGDEICDLGRGVCVGGFDDGESCVDDAACRGFCFEFVDTPCTEEDAALVCGGFQCLLPSGCFGGNGNGVDPECRDDCTIPSCGDGIIDPLEDCDDGLGVCIGGFDDQSDCSQGCRGICLTGPNTDKACFLASECVIGACSLGTCLGGNSDIIPGACPTDCTTGIVGP